MARPYGTELTGTLRFRAGQPLIDTLERKLKMRQAREPDFSMSDLLRELVSASVLPPTDHVPTNGGRTIAKANDPSRSVPRPPSKEQLRAELDAIGAEPEPERFIIAHIVQPDGSCLGGCDQYHDDTCTIGPNDPRRGRKKR